MVALSHPVYLPELGLFSTSLGYGLFFYFIKNLSLKRQFALAFIWAMSLHLFWLKWMAASPYMGPFIFLAPILFSIGVGLQFALLLVFIRWTRSTFSLAAGAGLWMLLEWSRLYWLCGYTWNLVGLGYLYSTASSQLASLVGVLGLSWLAMLTNLLAYRFLCTRKRSLLLAWASLVLAPLAFAWVKMDLLPATPKKGSIQGILVHTQWPPFQVADDPLLWSELLASLKGKKTELIVLPEFVVPFGGFVMLYDYDTMVELFKFHLGADPKKLAVLKRAPYYEQKTHSVNNLAFAKALALTLDVEVILGLEDERSEQSKNAAWHVLPNMDIPDETYAKQVLVPLGEYLPASEVPFLGTWLKERCAEMGVSQFMVPGEGPKAFTKGRVPFAINICYEETFWTVMRQLAQPPVELLINISNDAWFPNTDLPEQHFHHAARLRSIENGVPSVRATNTGVTAVISDRGEVLARVGKVPEDQIALLPFDLSLNEGARTFYNRFGDLPLLLVSFLSIGIAFWQRKD